MSALSTQPQVYLPVAQAGYNIPFTGTPFAYTSWLELVASASNYLQLSGFAFIQNASNSLFEFQFGTGAVGAETPKGTFFTSQFNSGNAGLCVVSLPVLADIVLPGERLAVRMRSSAAGGSFSVTQFAVEYFLGYTGDNKTNKPYSYWPDASTGISITPSGSAWANSSWVEVTPGFGTEVALLGGVRGVGGAFAAANTEYVIEWGTGAAGAETPITSVRNSTGVDASTQTQGFGHTWLPAPFPVAAATRIAARVRKSGTSTVAVTVSTLLIGPTSLLGTPCAGGGGVDQQADPVRSESWVS